MWLSSAYRLIMAVKNLRVFLFLRAAAGRSQATLFLLGKENLFVSTYFQLQPFA